jgi:hypothetical protein
MTCICRSSRLFRVTLEISRAECNIDVTPEKFTATDTCIGYHVTRFEVSRQGILHTRYVCPCVGAGGGRGRGTKIKTNVILHTRYVSTWMGAGGGRDRETKIKTKANCCGACYLTCDMYKSSLRHTCIHDPVLSSLKMKGIRFFFTVHTAMVYVIQVCRQLGSRSICSYSRADVMFLPWQRPATTNVSKTRSCNYSLEAPDNER